MEDVIAHYEKANDLAKQGKTDEAIASYKAGLALLQQSKAPDASSRITYFATKLGQLCWKLGRYAEARIYYEMMGQKMPKPPTTTQPFHKGLKCLQNIGLLSELSKELKEEILEEIGLDSESADEELELIDFLQVYYAHESGGLSSRAIKDGFLHHDWRFGQETGDVIGEICQLLGKQTLRQIGYHSEPCTETIGEKTLLTVESDTGERSSLEIQNGLDDIVAFVNRRLEGLGEKRRFVSIETNGDWFAYYLLDATAHKAIFGGKKPALEASNIPGIKGKSW